MRKMTLFLCQFFKDFQKLQFKLNLLFLAWQTAWRWLELSHLKISLKFKLENWTRNASINIFFNNLFSSKVFTSEFYIHDGLFLRTEYWWLAQSPGDKWGNFPVSSTGYNREGWEKSAKNYGISNLYPLDYWWSP